MWMIAIILGYFAVLFAISRWTGRKATNDTFFRGNRQSPWYIVAFGMIGASISGVTFVSVPGMVTQIDMTYMQTCLGFILGYALVAFLLLPLYYRLNLTTIYSYLGQRLGPRAYKTGASFFLLSKMIGAVVRFYVVCMILQQFVFDQRSLRCHSVRDGGTHLALHSGWGHQDAGVDGHLPDCLPLLGSAYYYI